MMCCNKMDPCDYTGSDLSKDDVHSSCECGSHKICDIIKNDNYHSDGGPVIMKNKNVLKMYSFHIPTMPL